MSAGVQIFGTRNSATTRAAERFFKERRIPIHFVDLQVKAMSPGEIKKFLDKFGLLQMVDKESKEYESAGLAYIRSSEAELLERIAKTPKLLRLPLVRSGQRMSIGHDEAAWKAMLESAK
jgi:arsenate reductase-like glutaredoxin family protein